MTRFTGRAIRLAFPAVLCLALLNPGPRAGLEVAIDAQTVSEFLGAVMPKRIDAPVAGTTVPVAIRDFKVLGFEPNTAGGGIKGFVDASLTVTSTDLGLSIPLKPRLAVRVVEVDGFRQCELRFEKVLLSVPFVGSANLAPMFQPVVLPADYLSLVPTGVQDVPVRTRLNDVRMGRQVLRMQFEILVNPKLPAR